MSILEHLEELRSRLLKIIVAAALGFAACYWKAEDIYGYIMQPLVDTLPEGTHLIYTGVTEGFFTYLKVGLLAGVFLVSPYIMYQIWAFISPGLYKKERTILIPVAIISAVLFVGGACFGYFVVFPWGFKFLIGNYASEVIKPLPSIKEYLSLAAKLLIAFGVVFEMPLATLVLARLGLVNHRMMLKYSRYALLGIFVVGAMLTPPDVVTQLMMAGPLIILYGVSILVAYFFGKKPAEIEEDDDEDETPPEKPDPDGKEKTETTKTDE
ncbi:MAG: twin-arginine translocase subunit TatC [Deltaproteobacteria bacterium]|nr:twin-arginine translocase subunit TatC [Candidatus Zymogenaceae bacterium]